VSSGGGWKLEEDGKGGLSTEDILLYTKGLVD